jgi:hypothetical protein
MSSALADSDVVYESIFEGAVVARLYPFTRSRRSPAEEALPWIFVLRQPRPLPLAPHVNQNVKRAPSWNTRERAAPVIRPKSALFML